MTSVTIGASPSNNGVYNPNTMYYSCPFPPPPEPVAIVEEKKKKDNVGIVVLVIVFFILLIAVIVIFCSCYGGSSSADYDGYEVTKEVTTTSNGVTKTVTTQKLGNSSGTGWTIFWLFIIFFIFLPCIYVRY